MRKTIIAIAAMFMLLASFSGAFAGENWEAWLTVRSGNAENRLAFGRHAEATDFQDSRFDIPALLAGDLRAYFYHEDGALWRDIRKAGPETTSWILKISVLPSTAGQVVITWDPEELPHGTELELIDSDGENQVNMTYTNHYEIWGSRDKRIIIQNRGQEN